MHPSVNPEERMMRVRGSNGASSVPPAAQFVVDGGDAYTSTADSLATYMRDIRRVERLTRDEEIELATARRDFDDQAADWVRALALRTGVTGGPYAAEVADRLRRDVRVAMCGSNAERAGAVESYYEAVRAMRTRYADELCNAGDADKKAGLVERMGLMPLRAVNAVFTALETESELSRKALRAMRSSGRSRLETDSSAGDALARKREERARRRLEELDRTQVLPVDELITIVAGMSDLLRRSREIADRLAETNLRLAAAIARGYTMDANTLMDLVQEGNLALMNAAKYFDPNRGYTFGTFAATAIRRRIGEYLANESTVLNVSQGMHQRGRRLRAAKEAVRADAEAAGRVHEPTFEEMAEYLGTNTAGVIETLDAVQTAARLDVPVGDRRTPRIDLIADEHAEDPCDTVDAFESAALMSKALDRLSKRERQVIEQRYFNDSVAADTLQSVGDSLGVTRERVRQIESRALRKLRCPKS